jgi:UDP-3-O-[3-hydroxymyristoyl] glucosamine N-acyltransferase
MSEPFFLPRAAQTSLADIVARTGAEVAEGADLSLTIIGVAPIDEAGSGELAVFDPLQDAISPARSRATACFVAPRHAACVPEGTVALIMDEPYVGFAVALHLLFPQAVRPVSLFGTEGINPGASIHPEARLEQGVIVDPGVVIGPRAEIGSGSIIGANSVIGADVRIGRACLIGPQVTITNALIGDRVTLKPGVRAGQSSIYSAPTTHALRQSGLSRAPSLGRVIIQDGVEIGANATIDRGGLGDTVIGEETRIGDLTRIAENATIGRHCIIPAQTEIPPGARLEDHFIAARAG